MGWLLARLRAFPLRAKIAIKKRLAVPMQAVTKTARAIARAESVILNQSFIHSHKHIAIHSSVYKFSVIVPTSP